MYETIIDHHNSTLEEDKIVDTSKLKRTEDAPPEPKESYHYTRYVMNIKDLNITPNEEDMTGIGASGTVTNKYAPKYDQYYKVTEAQGGQFGPAILKKCLEKARK